MKYELARDLRFHNCACCGADDPQGYTVYPAGHGAELVSRHDLDPYTDRLFGRLIKREKVHSPKLRWVAVRLDGSCRVRFVATGRDVTAIREGARVFRMRRQEASSGRDPGATGRGRRKR